MEILLLVLLNICFIGIFFSLYMLERNSRVFKERMKILNLASIKAKRLVELEITDWQEPYKYLDSVSYNEMLYKFWKPVNSFYDLSKL